MDKQTRDILCFYLIGVATVLSLLVIMLCFYFCPQVNAQEYTKEEKEVANVISAHACSEGLQGMWAVGMTIANNSKLLNKSPSSVIKSKSQYKLEHPTLDPNCTQGSLVISKNMFTLLDLTKGALYFRKESDPIKKYHKQLTFKIGKLSFYR